MFVLYFQKINRINAERKASKEEALARAYCSSYENNGKIHKAPMKSTYCRFVSQRIPTNDAFIMAEASIEHACVITENAKDFIYKNEEQDHIRATGIRIINIQNDLYDDSSDLAYPLVPQPFDLVKIAPILRGDPYDLQFPMSIDDNKEHGSTIQT